jgi:Predicted membrane protein
MKSVFHSIYGAIEKIIRRFDDDKVSVYAAQTSFFLIISSVPLVMLLITLLQYVLPVDRSVLNEFIINILPADNIIFKYIDNILDEIFGRTEVSIVSISAVTLLWSASRGFRSIARGIRNIYGSNKESNIIKNTLFSLVYTIIFIVILTISVTLIFFGSAMRYYLGNSNTLLSNVLNILLGLQGIIFFIVLVLIFALAYKGMARHEMKFKYQMIGAAFSAAGWIVFSFLYRIYIESFSNYSYIYGSLTAIILMMLWLYMCITILFIGAEINVWIYDKIKGTSYHKPRRRKNDDKK